MNQAVASSARPSEDLWAFADRIVCISLRDDEKAAARREEMMRWARERDDGLADRLTFFLAERHPESGVRGCFESHKEVSRRALEDGNVRTLVVFEDDAVPAPRRSKRQFQGTLGEVETISTSEAGPLQTKESVLLLGFMAFWVASHLSPLPGFRRVRQAQKVWCMHAYVLGVPGMRAVAGLEFDGRDIDRVLTVDNRLTAFVTYPMLFHQADADTSVTGLNVVVQRQMGGMGPFMDLTGHAAEWGAVWVALFVLFVLMLVAVIAIAATAPAWARR